MQLFDHWCTLDEAERCGWIRKPPQCIYLQEWIGHNFGWDWEFLFKIWLIYIEHVQIVIGWGFNPWNSPSFSQSQISMDVGLYPNATFVLLKKRATSFWDANQGSPVCDLFWSPLWTTATDFGDLTFEQNNAGWYSSDSFQTFDRQISCQITRAQKGVGHAP